MRRRLRELLGEALAGVALRVWPDSTEDRPWCSEVALKAAIQAWRKSDPEQRLFLADLLRRQARSALADSAAAEAWTAAGNVLDALAPLVPAFSKGSRAS